MLACPSVCVSMIIYYKFVSRISCKLLVGISSCLQLRCTVDKDILTRFSGQKVSGQGPLSFTFTFSFGVDYVQRWGRPSIAAQCATAVKVTVRPNMVL